MQAKYYIEKKQVSRDGGISWSDVIPLETRTGTTAYPNDVDCGGDMDYSTVGLVFKTITDGIGWVGYSTFRCGEASSGTCHCISIYDLISYSDVIQEAYVTENVDSLWAASFASCPYLTSVKLPLGLGEIGDGSFTDCPNLTEIEIPLNVAFIGRQVFRGSNNLKRIIVLPYNPPSINGTLSIVDDCKIYVRDESLETYKTSIGWSIFEDRIYPISDLYDSSKDCKFKKLKKQEAYESGLTQTWYDVGEYQSGDLIESGSSDCVGLITYRWSNTSAYTCDEFATCDPYKAVIDYFNVVSGGSRTSSSPYETICDNGNSVLDSNEINNFLGSGRKFVRYLINVPYAPNSYEVNYTSKLTILEVGNATTEISISGTDKTYLTSLTIASSVTTIRDSSFRGATSLSSFTIPSSVTLIEDNAFRDCTSLKSITCLATTPPTIGRYTFEGTNDCTIYVPETSVDVYKSSQIWDMYSDRIYPIGGVRPIKLLAESQSGVSYTIYCNYSSVLTSGETRSNSSWNSVTSCTIGDCVTSIGQSAFRNFSNLSSLTIPTQITDIDNFAFSYCTSLESITCLPTTPPTIGDYIFDSNLAHIYVPSSSVSAYQSATRWSDYASIIEAIPNS